MRQKRDSISNKSQIIHTVKSFLLNNKGKIGLLVLATFFVIGVNYSRAQEADDTQSVGSPAEIRETVQLTALNKDEQRLNQKFDVSITSAQRQKRVLVRGQWLRARDGKLFLVVNMDIKNNIRVAMHALPQDWMRLVKEENKEIAPTAHQGLVEIRPLSTKETNVAFVIDENETDFTINIGAVDQLDKTIKIEF